LASFVIACRPQGETAADVATGWSVEPRPPIVGPATLSLALIDRPTGKPVSGARVQVEANMSHPGMAPAFSEAREVAPGRYEAPLELTMAGDWILLVEATLRDGRTLQRQVRLAGVRREKE
jgi:hypothetical protein